MHTHTHTDQPGQLILPLKTILTSGNRSDRSDRTVLTCLCKQFVFHLRHIWISSAMFLIISFLFRIQSYTLISRFGSSAGFHGSRSAGRERSSASWCFSCTRTEWAEPYGAAANEGLDWWSWPCSSGMMFCTRVSPNPATFNAALTRVTR